LKVADEVKWLRKQTKRLNREVLELQRRIVLLELALLGVRSNG